MSGITFGNIQGNVSVSGTMAGRDIVQQSGLDPRDQAIFNDILARLDQTLAAPTPKAEKHATLTELLKTMMSLSADVTAKVLPTVLLAKFGG